MDFAFFKKSPFGVFMLAQTVLTLSHYVVSWFAPFLYEGFGFVNWCALTLFGCSLFYNVFHLMGWNRQILQLSSGINLFVPCTLIVFGVSTLFFLLYLVCDLIAIIGFFDSTRFTIRMMAVYGIIMMLCCLVTLVNMRLSVLLFRAAPNGKLLGLTSVIIDGEKTTNMENGQFSPVVPSAAAAANPV